MPAIPTYKMRYYCSLWDSGYLARGLVLYESLRRYSSEEFELIILAMDEECAQTLEQLRLPYVEVSRLDGFEMVACADKRLIIELRQAKTERTWQEYCWTLASQLALHIILKYRSEVTYLDADMMFFSDPKVVFDEIGECSIAVIPHRLIPSKRHLEVNGKFNVSWVTFKNRIGRECAERWAAQCRKRCSASIGCGDQVYLDEWPDLYGDELCIIQNIGAGLAPWNLANYEILASTDDKSLFLYERQLSHTAKVVFYHYHEFLEREDGTFRLTNYDLRPEDIAFIYEPYLEAYRSAKFRIAATRLNMAAADIKDFTLKLR